MPYRPTAVPKLTNTDSNGSNEVTSKDCLESLSIPSLNNTNHLSKSDTSAFRTPLKSTTPNFEFTAEIKVESTVGESGDCNNNSADSSGNNSALNCESHYSSLEAAVKYSPLGCGIDYNYALLKFPILSQC